MINKLNNYKPTTNRRTVREMWKMEIAPTVLKMYERRVVGETRGKGTELGDGSVYACGNESRDILNKVGLRKHNAGVPKNV